jgi:hypothetical protein
MVTYTSKYPRIFNRCAAGRAIFLLSVWLIIGSKVYAQTNTYPLPAPGWPGAFTPSVSTAFSSTTTVSGCQNTTDNGTFSESEVASEYVLPPFWYERPTSSPWAKGYGDVYFAFSVAPTGSPLTVVNGQSQGQGTVSQTETQGTYPATSGSGVGVQATYTITVSGHGISEQYMLTEQTAGTDQSNDTWLITSAYDVVSGILKSGVNPAVFDRIWRKSVKFS